MIGDAKAILAKGVIDGAVQATILVVKVVDFVVAYVVALPVADVCWKACIHRWS